MKEVVVNFGVVGRVIFKLVRIVAVYTLEDTTPGADANEKQNYDEK